MGSKNSKLSKSEGSDIKANRQILDIVLKSTLKEKFVIIWLEYIAIFLLVGHFN